VAVLAAGFLWTYWPVLETMAHRWSQDPQYSHGYLVPVFALFLLWHRRENTADLALRGSAWGLVVLLAGISLRLAGAYFFNNWLEAVSLPVCLLGMCLILGGGKCVRWSWPAGGFLLFMLPLPYQVEMALARPLQRLASVLSMCALQILGWPATAEGAIITLGDTRLGVAEACGGLSMLLTFFALTVAVALVLQRPRVDRIVLIASAIPIALFANVVRITVTGILFETVGSQVARTFFHDLAGWFMMALALGLLWVELRILARLFVEPEAPGPVPVHLTGKARA
jgi:exosortase